MIDWKFVSRDWTGIGQGVERYQSAYNGYKIFWLKQAGEEAKDPDQYLIEIDDDITIFYEEQDLINFVDGLGHQKNTPMEVIEAACILAGESRDFVTKITLKEFVEFATKNGICIDVSVIKGQEGYIR
jgi:hypothetical protein